MSSDVEEIRKTLKVLEYKNDQTDSNKKKMPEIPEWAYNLSTVFQSKSCSQPEVEKSVQKMLNNISITR